MNAEDAAALVGKDTKPNPNKRAEEISTKLKSNVDSSKDPFSITHTKTDYMDSNMDPSIKPNQNFMADHQRQMNQNPSSNT